MEQIIGDNARLWLDSSLLTETPAECFDISFWRQRGAVIGSAAGRGTTWFVQTATVAAALRHYHRGGLFGKCVKDSYLFTGWKRTRAYQEFVLLSYLCSQGIAVPRPIAARAVRRGLCYQADLLVEKINGARSLVDLLQNNKLNAMQYHNVGKLIRKLHNAGVFHSDLNIHNILLDTQDTFWLIDFDKCSRRSGRNWKAANLGRLRRSFRKEVLKRHIHWQERDWTYIIQGYNQAA